MQTTAIPQNEVPVIKRETVRELVRRHLSDPNHHTTEEELRNAMLETGVGISDYENLSTQSGN